MRFYDLIIKKRNGIKLNEDEIKFMIRGYIDKLIPDYQMSAMLMAIYFRGLDEEELTTLTKEMAFSGEIMDLSSIDGIKVDKHSTGGVGDKTTLIIGSIVASYGVKVAKMSGRGLGHTGGTIDKIESIPQIRTNLSKEEFFDCVNKVGFGLMAQSENIAPADKLLYSLRDVTGTVESIPLIAASIMSKKIAAGSDCILLDVKTGSGAFMKDIDSSIELAKKMVSIGEIAGKKTIALITNMDIPLGNSIGNWLEIKEVVEVLTGSGPQDLKEICIELAGNMLYLANKGSLENCKKMAKVAIEDKSAFNKLVEMIKEQGGDVSFIKNIGILNNKLNKKEVFSDKSGYISSIDTELLGVSSCILGAGRETKESKIDYLSGIIIHKKLGEKIEKGDLFATMYSSDSSKFDLAQEKIKKSLIITSEKTNPLPLILARIENNSINKYI